jgi:glutamate N-acetyltransferase / amino-acid N-acetyltransferase
MRLHVLNPRVYVYHRMASSSVPKTRHVLPIDPSTLPRGFVATGVYSGIKKNASMLDLGLVLSTAPVSQASSAACFTRNAFKAAPVTVSADVLEKSAGRARAIVVNSGCANAVTGKQGVSDAWAMCRATDSLLKSEDASTLVMSTGVIGQNLPIARILAGIESAASSLGSSPEHWQRVARAFMTTDTFPKIRARSFHLGGPSPVRILGIDKGAGMIHPNMGPAPAMLPLHATLLGLIATDARVSPRSLQSALTYAVDRSFNSISVDGDMSTNDTIVALANGEAGGVEVDEHNTPREYELFRTELTNFAIELAQLVVRDGEGATKFVTIAVNVRSCAEPFSSVNHASSRGRLRTQTRIASHPQCLPLH